MKEFKELMGKYDNRIVKDEPFKIFGLNSTDNIAVAIVYFVQGALGLAKLAVSFYLKDDLRLLVFNQKIQFSRSITIQFHFFFDALGFFFIYL
jgi:hypothetical protein